MNEVEQAEQARADAKDALESLPNVVGHGVGVKEVGGEITDEVCVRVYVAEKVAASELAPHERIPSTIGGTNTDVIVQAPIELVSDTKVRPPSPGTQIARAGFLGVEYSKGTICAIVFRNPPPAPGQLPPYFILTCAHVLDPTVAGAQKPIDGIVHQPLPFGIENRIGLFEGSPLLWQDGVAPDCGLVRIDDYYRYSNRIIGGSLKLTKTQESKIKERVAKCGATTDTTTGVILDASFHGTVQGLKVQDCYVVMQDKGIPAMADHGDSGSPLYIPGSGPDEAALTGLIFAAEMTGTRMAFAQKIANVFQALDVSLAHVDWTDGGTIVPADG